MVSFGVCAGNPGALTFLMKAYELDMYGAEKAFSRMQENRIFGAMLYMLWNDCCARNTVQALFIMKYCDLDKIREHINYGGGRGIPFTEEEIEELENADRQRWRQGG